MINATEWGIIIQRARAARTWKKDGNAKCRYLSLDVFQLRSDWIDSRRRMGDWHGVKTYSPLSCLYTLLLRMMRNQFARRLFSLFICLLKMVAITSQLTMDRTHGAHPIMCSAHSFVTKGPANRIENEKFLLFAVVVSPIAWLAAVAQVAGFYISLSFNQCGATSTELFISQIYSRWARRERRLKQIHLNLCTFGSIDSLLLSAQAQSPPLSSPIVVNRNHSTVQHVACSTRAGGGGSIAATYDVPEYPILIEWRYTGHTQQI